MIILLKSRQILKELRYENGLFSASKRDVKTGYNRVWIRDNIYAILGLEKTSRKEAVRTLRALLDILLKHEYKIDFMIKQPNPKYTHRYIHARYDPETGNEIYEEWGNKQNDAVGGLLFKTGQLENKGVKILRNHHDKRILHKLVLYLKAIEYWHDKDNGMWEENEEIHASSVGACVAGLKQISKIVDVPKELITKGEKILKKLLPRESETKDVDMALLSLIYPYNLADKVTARKILQNVERKLVRDRGVIRYKGDAYYANGKEAEWVMGFPWLATIYKQMKNPRKYAYYMRKTMQCFNKNHELPELYFGGTDIHNENTPLTWAQSLYIVARS